jgi:hypothetical protein
VENDAYLLVTAVGQALLQAGQYSEAVGVLQAARDHPEGFSPCLYSCVLSTLACVYWVVGNTTGAIDCVRHDLTIAKSVGMSRQGLWLIER